MGGFAFDNSQDPTSVPFPGNRSRLTLTPKGLILLAKSEPDLVPDISADDIMDKSKANALAKAIVCVQALWFCLDVLTRLGFGLPITLLELNTFAHAICALAIYYIWWDKPLDVGEPTMISACDPTAGPVCAAMCLASDVGCRIPYVLEAVDAKRFEFRSGFCHLYGIVSVSPRDTRTASPAAENGDSEEQAGSAPPAEPRPTADTQIGPPSAEPDEKAQLGVISGSKPPAAIPLRFGETFEASVTFTMTEMEIFSSWVLSVISPSDSWTHTVLASETVLLTPTFQSLLALSRQRPGPPLCPPPPERPPWQPRLFVDENLVTPKLLNWPFALARPDSDGERNDEVGEVQGYVGAFAVAGLLYSGWHLTAWAGPFRTEVEGLLWRIAALGVGPAGLLLAAAFPVVKAWIWLREEGVERFKLPKAVGLVFDLAFSVILSFVFPVLVLLVFCRVYLVVESFLSLPYVPDGVFVLPDWSPYFPHIG